MRATDLHQHDTTSKNRLLTEQKEDRAGLIIRTLRETTLCVDSCMRAQRRKAGRIHSWLLTAASCRRERGWGVTGTGARLYARPPVSTLLFQWDTRMCYCQLPSAKEPEWLRDNGKPCSVSESRVTGHRQCLGKMGWAGGEAVALLSRHKTARLG